MMPVGPFLPARCVCDAAAAPEGEARVSVGNGEDYSWKGKNGNCGRGRQGKRGREGFIGGQRCAGRVLAAVAGEGAYAT